MALVFKSIDYDDTVFETRLDSKYYILQLKLKNFKETCLASLKSFGEYITVITDGEHAGQVFVSSGVLFLKNSSIKDFDISRNDGFYISEEKHRLLNRSALKAEDILFTTIGHLGSAAIVPVNFGEANMNQNFVKITIDKNLANPYYLTCFLNSKFVRKQVRCLLTGNIQSILTYPKIKSIKIIYPKNQETIKKVENYYKEAIELSKQAESLINSALEIFKNNLLEKHISNRSEKVYSVQAENLDDNIWTPKFYFPEYIKFENYLKENFKYDFLGDIALLYRGDEPGSDSYSSYLDKLDSDIPFVRTSDLYNYQLDLLPDNFIDKNTYKTLNQKLLLNDIIYTKDGKIGEVAMLTSEDKVIIASGNECIRLNDLGKKKGYTQEYLFTALISKYIGKYNAERYTVVASTIPHLKEDYIKKFAIPLMEKSIIEKITNKISQAFLLIGQKKKLVNKCRVIIDAFNDELDL